MISLMLVLVTACITGCSAPVPIVDGEELLPQGTPAGPDLLERLLSADDPIGALSAYAAAAGDTVSDPTLDFFMGRALYAQGRRLEACAAFANARQAPEADLAAAARLYDTACAVDRGQRTEAYQKLGTHPADPNPWVDPVDQARFWAMLGEAHLQAGALPAALAAFGAAFTAAEAQHQEAWAHYAKVRAFESSAAAPEALSQHADPCPLIRAVQADAAFRRSLGTQDRDQMAAAAVVARTALAEIGDTQRVTEIERLMEANDDRDNAVVIGVILPLTGESRRMGRAVLGGILQGQGAFASGGGRRLTFVFKDSRSLPSVAKEAVAELDAMGAIAIIGPLDGEEARQAAQDASQRGIPLIAMTYDANIASLGAYRFGIDVDGELQHLARESVARGLTQTVMVYPDSPYANTIAQRFEQAYLLAGGSIVTTHVYAPGTTDLRKVAASLAKLSFDAIFVPTTADDAAFVASFLAQENIWSRNPEERPGPRDPRRFITFLGSSTWYADDLPTRAARYLSGAIFPVSYAPQRPGEVNRFFVDTFRDLYERLPATHEAIAYDLARLIKDLVSIQGINDRSRVTQALDAGSSWQGVTGAQPFNQRNTHPEPLLLQIGPAALTPLTLTLPTTTIEGTD